MDTRITSEVGTLIGVLDNRRIAYDIFVIGTAIVSWGGEQKEINLRRLTFRHDGVIIVVEESLIGDVLVSKRT
jgi:hypothetical protein